jgi:hypothetical protein
MLVVTVPLAGTSLPTVSTVDAQWQLYLSWG